MERASVLIVLSALVVMLTIGAAAASIDSSVEHDAGDLFDSPVASVESTIADEVDSRTDSDESEASDDTIVSDSSGESSESTSQNEEGPVAQASDPAPPGKSSLSIVYSHVPIVPVLLFVGLVTLAVRYRSSIKAMITRTDLATHPKRTRSPAVGTLNPSNPVSAIWLDFVTTLDVDGYSSKTTTEVAEYAIAEGMEPAAVWALTAAFEEVEYGEYPTIDERIRRARVARDRLLRGDSGQ